MTTAVARNIQPLSSRIRYARAGRDQLSPQALRVLAHLEAAGSITNVEAHAVLKCRSVSRRITELVDAGFNITKEHKRDSQGQRYVRYVLN